MKKIPAHRHLEEQEFIILELDITGNNPNDDEIIRIVALKSKNNITIDRFCKYIKTSQTISDELKEAYKLDETELSNAESEIKVLNDFYEWINAPKEYILIITENYSKTIKFLNYYNKKHNRTVPKQIGYDVNDLLNIFESEYNSGNKIDIFPLINGGISPYIVVENMQNICKSCCGYYVEDKTYFNKEIYNKEFIIMDIETSGLEPTDGAEVIRIVAYKIKNKKISDTFCQLIKPDILLSDKIKELTKISNEELITDGISYKEAIQKFYKWWGNIPAVTDNLPFICKFVKYYDEKNLLDDYNRSRCFELKWIVRKKFKEVITRSPKKMMKIINPDFLDKLEENKFYYLNLMWYLVNEVHKEDK